MVDPNHPIYPSPHLALIFEILLYVRKGNIYLVLLVCQVVYIYVIWQKLWELMGGQRWLEYIFPISPMRKVILGEIKLFAQSLHGLIQIQSGCAKPLRALYTLLFTSIPGSVPNLHAELDWEEGRICCDGENILKPCAWHSTKDHFSVTWIIYKLIIDLLLFGQIPFYLNLSFQMDRKRTSSRSSLSASPVITLHPLLDQPWPIFFSLHILWGFGLHWSGLWLLQKANSAHK